MVVRTIALGGLLAFLLASGCGPKVPAHDGYRRSEPWKKSKRLKFDKDNEAVVDGAVSYPQQRRARWYVLDLPGDGELKITMDITPLGDTRKDLALGFEVLDKGFNSVMRKYPDPDPEAASGTGTKKRAKKAKKAKKKSGDDDDDWDDDDDDDDEWDDDDDIEEGEEEPEGELEWEQTLMELRAGRYFIHVYTLGRMDEAEYSMRVKYSSGAATRVSNFPTNVAYYEPLPVVPAFDDAPGVDCGSCSCRSDSRCKSECGKCNRTPVRIDCKTCDCSKSRTCARKCSKCPKDSGDSGDSDATATTARIIRYVAAGGGTKITLNRGSSAGVAAGWKGRVINSQGKTISSGTFTVDSVTSTTATGQVGASPDAVRAAGKARLSPP